MLNILTGVLYGSIYLLFYAADLAFNAGLTILHLAGGVVLNPMSVISALVGLTVLLNQTVGGGQIKQNLEWGDKMSLVQAPMAVGQSGFSIGANFFRAIGNHITGGDIFGKTGGDKSIKRQAWAWFENEKKENWKD